MLSPVTRVPTVPPGRRTFLALGTTLGTLALTGSGLAGCSTIGGSTASAGAFTLAGRDAAGTAEDAMAAQAVEWAVAAVTALHTGASNLAAGNLPNGATLRIKGSLAKLLGQVTAVHAAQLAQLGSPVPDPAASDPATATPTATTDEEGFSSPADLVTAEWDTARTALRDAAGLPPEFAVLLYRVAAACAANADLLRAEIGGKAFGDLKAARTEDADGSSVGTGTTGETAGETPDAATSDTTTPDTTGAPDPGDSSSPGLDEPTPDATASPGAPALETDETTALNRLLSGEHAAFYAYPLVIAHVGGSRRDVANALWEAHRQQRDDLERLLLAAGAEPAGAGAAYEVATPATAAKAAALAARIERRLAGLAVDVIAAATDDSVEATAADLLVLGTRRQAAWTGKPVTDPGT